MMKQLFFSLVLTSLSIGAAHAQSLNYYCKATIAPSTTEGLVDFTLTRKFVLSELQLNYKLNFNHKKAWNIAKGNSQIDAPAKIADSILSEGFDLELTLSGKSDGEQLLTSNLILANGSQGPAQSATAKSEGTFSSFNSVSLDLENLSAKIYYDVTCSMSLRLIDNGTSN